jgi:hypothetical protein
VINSKHVQLFSNTEQALFFLRHFLLLLSRIIYCFMFLFSIKTELLNVSDVT